MIQNLYNHEKKTNNTGNLKNPPTIAITFQQHLINSSLAINLIFHCLRTYYIISTATTVTHSFVDLTSPLNSKVTWREIPQKQSANLLLLFLVRSINLQPSNLTFSNCWLYFYDIHPLKGNPFNHRHFIFHFID